MTNSKYFRKKRQVIGTRFQGIALIGKYPGSGIVSCGSKHVTWRGYIQPTPFSIRYFIRLKYRIKERPNVFVMDPKLTQEDLPHTFGDDGSLCLFRYKYYEWNSTMLIADTIIPWTSLWLYFYEQWLVTGKWLGGGEHPSGKDG